MNKKTCFFVTPIGAKESDARKNADNILKHLIKPVCESLDFEVIRVDEINTVDNINETIIKHLSEDDLVIVDMTGHNPNVFYEFGYRQSKELPLIPIITEGEKIPFDVSAIRTISYIVNDWESTETFKDKLTNIIKSFNFDSPERPPNGQIDDTSLSSIHAKLDKITSLIKEKNVVQTRSSDFPRITSADLNSAQILGNRLSRVTTLSHELHGMQIKNKK